MEESTDARIARIDANVSHIKELITPLAAKVEDHSLQLEGQNRDRKWLIGLVTLVAGAGGHGVHKVLDWLKQQ